MAKDDMRDPDMDERDDVVGMNDDGTRGSDADLRDVTDQDFEDPDMRDGM